jgi:methylmalonyl-CoA mutase
MSIKEKPTGQGPLFDDFPSVTKEEWKEKATADLKGADFEKKLVWNTPEGFKVQPFYTPGDLPEGVSDELPAMFPFRRGNKLDNAWHIRQDIHVKHIKEANKKALDILMKGITSLGFIIDPKFEPTIDELEKLCENIYADAVELNFISYQNSRSVVEYVGELVRKYNRKPQDIYGSVDFDPLGQFVLRGVFPDSAEASFDMAREIIESASHLPNFKTLTINGTSFHNAGASIVQELAFSLSQGVNYLTQLTERGLSVNQVAPRIKFHLAIGPDFFMEIAKLRAARMLWAEIVKAYGPCDDSKTRMFIHGITGVWNKTLYDPYVNMLRTTTEAMAGIAGGLDSLTILPFNAVYEDPTEFSERIARNQQLLLKEESYFDKVADPAAGSYYIENLTDSIASQAWQLFLEVQERGGFLEAFNAGLIQEAVRKTAQEKDRKISSRRITLLGSNQYPNGGENIDASFSGSVLSETDLTDRNAAVETLKPYRGAQPFERLRNQTDRYAASGKRPKVFLIPMGNLAFRRARAQFAANFFGCAGYEVTDNNGFATIEEGVAACKEASADIAVVCSTDDAYADLAPALYEQLKGDCIVVVAGYPKDILEKLQEQGIEHFIHLRSNVLETLSTFQNLLGIAGKA